LGEEKEREKEEVIKKEKERCGASTGGFTSAAQ